MFLPSMGLTTQTTRSGAVCRHDVSIYKGGLGACEGITCSQRRSVGRAIFVRTVDPICRHPERRVVVPLQERRRADEGKHKIWQL